MRKRIATIGVALGGVLLSISACGSPEAPTAPEPTVATESAAAVSPDGFTRAVFRLTWDEFTPQDREDICSGLALFGREGSIDILRSGVGEHEGPEIDWDLMYDLMIGECS